MGISTRPLRMRPLMTRLAEQPSSRVVVAAARLGSLGNRKARPIWALQATGAASGAY